MRDALRREPCRGSLAYCYSGMEREEGTFLTCGLKLVEAFALLDDQPAAVRQMDAVLEACGGYLGLLHERLDAGTGAMLGNVPRRSATSRSSTRRSRSSRGGTRCPRRFVRQESNIGHIS